MRTVRTQTTNKRKLKISSLDQNLRREDTNDVIDPVSKESVAEAVISRVQMTARVDLSKLDPKNKQ